MSRPDMRFVPIKSADQQAVLMLHKTRELLVKQRTMAVNALRGHLSEFGLIAPKGIHRVKELLALAQADQPFPKRPSKQPRCWLRTATASTKRSTIWRRRSPGRAVDQMSRFGRDPRLRPADRIGDGRFQSRSQRLQVGKRFQRVSGHYSSQHSSGGKDKLGAITKKGDRYLRKMLVVGCTSVLRVAHEYKGALAEWIVALKARKPERIVAVALANKLAGIAWAMM